MRSHTGYFIHLYILYCTRLIVAKCKYGWCRKYVIYMRLLQNFHIVKTVYKMIIYIQSENICMYIHMYWKVTMNYKKEHFKAVGSLLSYLRFVICKAPSVIFFTCDYVSAIVFLRFKTSNVTTFSPRVSFSSIFDFSSSTSNDVRGFALISLTIYKTLYGR